MKNEFPTVMLLMKVWPMFENKPGLKRPHVKLCPVVDLSDTDCNQEMRSEP